MPDFNAATPPASVTNPAGGSGAKFPAHVYKAKKVDKADGPEPADLIVAWQGKNPVYNEILDVKDAAALADALAAGYSEAPVVGEPDADAPKKSKK